MCLTFAFVFTIFTGINANLIPNNFIEINQFALTNDEFNIKINKLESLKNILIQNLIVTSDNLKSILNLESENKQSKDTRSLSNENSLDIQTLLSEDDFEKNNNRNENPFNSQSLLGESTFNYDKQTMEDEQPKNLNKRQIGGGGDSNSQVVLGTFQAIMRPVPGLGGLTGGGQSVQSQNENVSASQDDRKNEENKEK